MIVDQFPKATGPDTAEIERMLRRIESEAAVVAREYQFQLDC